VVRVHYDEDLASHIGPKPCAGTREDVGEASAGERVGQPLSHEILIVLGLPTRLVTRKAIPGARNRERSTGPGGVVESGMLRRSVCGNREISGLTTGNVNAVVRIGKVRNRSR